MSDIEKEGDKIQETEIAEPKKKRKSPNTKKKDSFTGDEVTEKVFLIFNGLSKLTGRENTYKQKDFEQEGRALVRMADKFDIISHVITIFDPVVFILGLFTKFTGLMKKKKHEPEKTQEVIS
jgi:hypothetical protein